MRGESEKRCFDIVWNSIYKAATLNRESLHLVNTQEPMCRSDELLGEVEHYFGLSEDGAIKFGKLLQSAIPNPNASMFPDFVSELGFIEHFQVTSSKTNRKGSVHKKEESLFLEKVEESEKQFKSEMDITPSFGEMKSMHLNFSFPEHSYEFFVKSFISTWNHHIKSYKNYQGAKEIGAFMIEYQDMALKMCEDFGDIKCGLWYGDLLRREERYLFYRLSRDKQLLRFIYRFKDVLKFVIMVSGNNVEVICVENIPELLKLLPYEFKIYSPTIVGRQVSLCGISVPNTVVGKEKESCD